MLCDTPVNGYFPLKSLLTEKLNLQEIFLLYFETNVRYYFITSFVKIKANKMKNCGRPSINLFCRAKCVKMGLQVFPATAVLTGMPTLLTFVF